MLRLLILFFMLLASFGLAWWYNPPKPMPPDAVNGLLIALSILSAIIVLRLLYQAIYESRPRIK